MRLSRHYEIQKDLKKLKRFKAPLESLESWERLFCSKGLKETPGIKQYPGLGREKIFKARVIPIKENCGKSDGYRLIFKVVSNDSYEIIVFSRHGVYKDENGLVKIIKSRL